MMGWFTDARNWARNVWQHDAVAAVASYSYQTIDYCFQQIGVLPRVVRSVWNHQPTQIVATHLVRITVEDILPLVIVSYVNQFVQEQGRAYLDEDEEPRWISTNTVVEYSLSLLNLAAWVIRVNRKTELIARMAIVTIEAVPMLNGVKTSLPMTVCIDGAEPCTRLRFMQGSIRDIAAYWSSEAAIALIGYTPIVGGSLAAVLSVYHNGRYVLTVVLPDLCNRHQVVYLRDNSGLALSLGLMHSVHSMLVNSLIEMATGVPRVFYEGAISQLMLITQMSVAAHLSLPAPQKSSTRRLPDPVLYFQNGIGFIVDILLLGLKAKIPRILKGKEPGNINDLFRNLSLDETTWLGRLISLSETIGVVRLARMVLPRLLPKLLHGKHAFLHDPIVSSNWATVQASIVNTLKTIESLHDELLVQVASYTPNTAAKLVESVFGTPKFITKLLLQLVSDDDVIEQLRRWRYQVEKLHIATAPLSLPVDHEAMLLPGQMRVSNAPLPSLIGEDSSPLPEPEQVIRMPGKAKTSAPLPSVDTVIRLRATRTTLNDIAPEHVIRHSYFHHKKPVKDTGVTHDPLIPLDDWTIIDDGKEQAYNA